MSRSVDSGVGRSTDLEDGSPNPKEVAGLSSLIRQGPSTLSRHTYCQIYALVNPNFTEIWGLGGHTSIPRTHGKHGLGCGEFPNDFVQVGFTAFSFL